MCVVIFFHATKNLNKRKKRVEERRFLLENIFSLWFMSSHLFIYLSWTYTAFYHAHQYHIYIYAFTRPDPCKKKFAFHLEWNSFSLSFRSWKICIMINWADIAAGLPLRVQVLFSPFSSPFLLSCAKHLSLYNTSEVKLWFRIRFSSPFECRCYRSSSAHHSFTQQYISIHMITIFTPASHAR